MRRATWSLAGAPRPVWPWIEQVNTLRVPATPFPHSPRAAGQLEGGGGSGASLREYNVCPLYAVFIHGPLTVGGRYGLALSDLRKITGN